MIIDHTDRGHCSHRALQTQDLIIVFNLKMADASETQPLLNSQAVLRAARNRSKLRFILIFGLGFVVCGLIIGITLPLLINNHRLGRHKHIDPSLVEVRVFDSDW